jgi:hypothetical protein
MRERKKGERIDREEERERERERERGRKEGRTGGRAGGRAREREGGRKSIHKSKLWSWPARILLLTILMASCKLSSFLI